MDERKGRIVKKRDLMIRSRFFRIEMTESHEGKPFHVTNVLKLVGAPKALALLIHPAPAPSLSRS